MEKPKKYAKITVITFAPVQGFIEKSRKLRDLYGSSFLISYLAWMLCKTAEVQYQCQVISPALINVIQGTPNQIIIDGDFPENAARNTLNLAWKCVTKACQEWLEDCYQIPRNYKLWNRVWQLWINHTWEFFWVQKENSTIDEARQLLNNCKYQRDWTGINWQGESSTLSGADAIAYPQMDQIADPRQYNYQEQKASIGQFYQAIQQKFGESFIDSREELSLPELVKRIITHQDVSNRLIEKVKKYFLHTENDFYELFKDIQQLAKDLNIDTFKELNRHENNYWTGWFMGDGDEAGKFLKKYPDKTKEFSETMRHWGKNFKDDPPENCRVVYAGGDDFFGIFYDIKTGKQLNPYLCIQEFIKFKEDYWHKPEKKDICASVGFVWTGAGVPQRDVLQHCREAEKSAKSHGRDRIAMRVLFNNGNYIEWVCPWEFLEILNSYEDRNKTQPNFADFWYVLYLLAIAKLLHEEYLQLLDLYFYSLIHKRRLAKPNWTHIYNDIATLESRHAFGKTKKESREIALALIDIYFPSYAEKIRDENNWWNKLNKDEILETGGILGDRTNYTIDNTTNQLDQQKINQAINNWVINLAKIGFHLCS
ncbi:type III-B CRISPR-associated protein Cas10/Cmr2 (plasmid) [Okeanomitos corallinicola TIOX110]|uniref:Type III-B CRISPR-associated protein Cas10/Cmr2 n=1 Tax=Okeanomitos corallinicola TIOX110 TaxID=3133117 RepID=A0ABZ2V1T0_9CYAN